MFRQLLLPKCKVFQAVPGLRKHSIKVLIVLFGLEKKRKILFCCFPAHKFVIGTNFHKQKSLRRWLANFGVLCRCWLVGIWLFFWCWWCSNIEAMHGMSLKGFGFKRQMSCGNLVVLMAVEGDGDDKKGNGIDLEKNIILILSSTFWRFFFISK